MKSLLLRDIKLDRFPLSMAGIVQISAVYGIGLSKFNQKPLKTC